MLSVVLCVNITTHCVVHLVYFALLFLGCYSVGGSTILVYNMFFTVPADCKSLFNMNCIILDLRGSKSDCVYSKTMLCIVCSQILSALVCFNDPQLSLNNLTIF